jgi:hypothetical protein
MQQCEPANKQAEGTHGTADVDIFPKKSTNTYKLTINLKTYHAIAK